MTDLFSEFSPYKGKARFVAILWTLLIFFLCFLPGKDIPDVNIPFIDKWVHLLLFGMLTLIWHLSQPIRNIKFAFILLVAAIFQGWIVEYIQGHFTQGRTQDNMDTLADTTGAIIGIIMFYVFSVSHVKCIDEN